MNAWSDQHAQMYDEEWGELNYHQEIPKLAQVKPHHTVLEIGCGGGFLSLCLARQANLGKVLAIDPTHKMITLANARQKVAGIPSSRLQFSQIGAEALCVDAESMDIAIAAFSLHHWQSPKLAMALVFQAMKTGGRLWLCEDLSTPMAYGGDMAVHDHLKAYSGIESLLKQSGFSSIQHRVNQTEEGTFLEVCASKPKS